MKMSFHVFLNVCVVLIACCLNVVLLETIIRQSPGSGNLITFAQFLFISIEGFVFVSNFGQKKPEIPLRKYITLVIAFFLVNVSNNLALNYKISVPLHIIFRSGSLLANLFLGVLILKRKYSFRKYFSVFIITFGIILATLASSQTGSEDKSTGSDFLIGILLLSFALLLSARLGIFQELLFQNHGKHPKEAVFYQHALSLPGFLLLLDDIWHQIFKFNQSEPLIWGIPSLWAWLLLNCVTQYLCIQSVMRLMSECTSLSVTLVLTLRKFLSLLFSIFYFRNAFTALHWSGTLLVFLGTFLFLDFKSTKIHSEVTVKPLLRKEINKSSEEEDNNIIIEELKCV